MRDILKYGDYLATIHYSTDDDIFFGKIEGINDLVMFEGESIKELKQSFHEAVDDYVNICTEHSREPFKSYKGSFNVRVSPELHKKANELAVIEGMTLNQLVQKAIEREVNRQSQDIA